MCLGGVREIAEGSVFILDYGWQGKMHSSNKDLNPFFRCLLSLMQNAEPVIYNT